MSKPVKRDVPAGFDEEIARRTALAREARAAINKPSAKLTQAEREHLHTFAFSAVDVRREMESK